VAFDCEEFYTDERIQPKETKEQQWWKKEAKKTTNLPYFRC
jgi:hypothetical protein